MNSSIVDETASTSICCVPVLTREEPPPYRQFVDNYSSFKTALKGRHRVRLLCLNQNTLQNQPMSFSLFCCIVNQKVSF